MGLFELLESSVMDSPRFSFSNGVVLKLFIEPIPHTLTKGVDSRSCRALRFLVADAFVVTAWIVSLSATSELDRFALG